DRAVDATTAEQRRVGGVDDRLDFLLGDVCAHEHDAGFADLDLHAIIVAQAAPLVEDYDSRGTDRRRASRKSRSGGRGVGGIGSGCISPGPTGWPLPQSCSSDDS